MGPWPLRLRCRPAGQRAWREALLAGASIGAAVPQSGGRMPTGGSLLRLCAMLLVAVHIGMRSALQQVKKPAHGPGCPRRCPFPSRPQSVCLLLRQFDGLKAGYRAAAAAADDASTIGDMSDWVSVVKEAGWLGGRFQEPGLQPRPACPGTMLCGRRSLPGAPCCPLFGRVQRQRGPLIDSLPARQQRGARPWVNASCSPPRA